jgi:hypothetical protein
MDIFSIILICITAIVLYLLITSSDKSENYTQNIKKKHKKRRINTINELIDDVVSWDDSQSNCSSRIEVKQQNPYFLDVQFNDSYRDVITGINNIIPDRKQLFNIANVPLKYSEPPVSEVKNLVNDFITVLNKTIITQVPSVRNPNSGWDEAIPDPNMKSGWDYTQEALGLQPSLYDKPAHKCIVELIAIRFVQKYETEDEIKYACEIVLQKKNVDDQLVIKASFVQDKRPLRDENNFFASKNIELQIIIEDVFIIGYLSKQATEYRFKSDPDEEKFYDYQNMEQNNLTDPKYVQKVLLDKYSQRQKEVEYKNAMLDEEGQAFHRTLPSPYDYSNVRATRTILDDMNTHKRFI